MMKVFIASVEFSPEKGRRQEIRLLLDQNNCLPAGNNIEKVEEALGSRLEIGKIFYKTATAEYWFANIKNSSSAKRMAISVSQSAFARKLLRLFCGY